MRETENALPAYQSAVPVVPAAVVIVIRPEHRPGARVGVGSRGGELSEGGAAGTHELQEPAVLWEVHLSTCMKQNVERDSVKSYIV